MKRRIFCAILALMLLLCACTASAATWQEQYDLGVRYLSEGNYREAIIAFTAAIEIDPKRAEAYVGRGQAYVLSSETEENLAAARADFEAAIELDETLAEAWLGLADVYIRLGDYDRALEILQEALEKTGNDPSVAGKIAEIESGNIKDSSGKLRRTSYFNENGELVWYLEYTYNVDRTEACVTSWDAAGNQLDHLDLGYDEGRGVYVSFSLTMDGRLYRYEIESDESGRTVKTTHYNENGEINNYQTFQYDENGKVIRRDSYSPDGTLTGYYVSEYNSDGREIKGSNYNADGSLFNYSTHEYDSNGKLVQVSYYNGNGELTQYMVYRDDEQGRWTDTYDGDGNLKYSLLN